MYSRKPHLSALLSASILLLVAACNNAAEPATTEPAATATPLPTTPAAAPADTTGAYKVAGHWITPRQSFAFNDSARLSADTLVLATCADYVYYPFGPIQSESQLRKSRLQDFTVSKVVRQVAGEPTEFQQLRRGGSTLVLTFPRPADADEFWGSYLVQGEIRDTATRLQNGIQVGMPVSQFYNVFFAQFPRSLQNQVRVVVLDPCISGNPRHVYSFRDGKLAAIQFACADCAGVQAE